ncbi:hypothetical protein EC973_002845 [Apophysomyces ossiformis]|uniref:C2H2-type domain-containing protein n=1 Tax=Apophysomyces ossiformis TaxID=679940 RepID=A0A8H7EMM7_9FUNG|nr:hypothetical protein EC973_002845 [Apophysomyces ossiformis]
MATTPSAPKSPIQQSSAPPLDAGLVCQWQDCMRTFPDHTALGTHLSEDHVGWKKGEYCCEWTRCSRQGIKCHNRFALMMHLRIHTGEKPFECVHPGCNQTFGRMDALMRHRKTEHGEEISTDVKGKSPANPARQVQRPSMKKKPKAPRADDHHADMKIKRRRLQESGQSLDVSDDSNDSLDEADLHPEHFPARADRYSTSAHRSSAPANGSSSINKYKLAKAKLQYILRENEMLNDEYAAAQKKLKRLRTERRVLLEALMAAEGDQGDDDEDDSPVKKRQERMEEDLQSVEESTT